MLASFSPSLLFTRYTSSYSTMESNSQGIIPASDASKQRKRPTEAKHIPTAPKEPPSAEFLCQDCVKLDLSKAFSAVDLFYESVRWGYFNNWAINVGHRYRVMRKTDCNLCRMLFRSRIGGEDLPLDSDVDWIRVVSFSRFSGLAFRFSGFWKSTNFPILMLFPHKNYDLEKNYRIVEDRIRLSGYAVLQQLSHQKAIPVSLKAIPSAFDLGTFQNWFSYCNRNHRLLCHSPKSELCGTRVIDCQEQSIADHKPGMPYLALSYVWGQPQEQKEVAYRNRLPAKLPLLIRDAMAATQAMGFRYLWVDRYCIDQDNPTVKHEQIRQMDAIYSNAEVTIIAAAGQDENYGLSGVGRNRPATRTAHIGDVVVVWAPADPQAAIKLSKWSTRGWTFQEALLSRRRLVFTEQQAYFECSAMNIYESLDIPLQSLHIVDRSKSDAPRRGVFGGNRKREFGRFIPEKQTPVEIFSRYLSNVEEYSARKLTYAEDSLNAFRGIAQQFWYGKHAVHNIWGLAYHPAPPEERTSSFAHSLSWRHTRNCWDLSQSPQRRPQFPSWSWAGWEGEVRYDFYSSNKKSYFDNFIRAVSFESQIDSPIALEMIAPNSDETCILPVVILTAAVVPPNLISFSPNDKHWQIGKHKADLALSCGSVSESQFAEDIHDNHIWQCVCIGVYHGRSFVMILKVDDGSDLWERAGMFTIDGFPGFTIKYMVRTWEYKSIRVR
ncbi:heterokaryon incompatibility domain-containing protein [Trichoderma camerunense]